MRRLKQLGRDSVIYGIGAIPAKGLYFFILPILTKIFSPADFGKIEILTMISGLLGTILVMGMDSAQSYFFFEMRDRGLQQQGRVISSILIWKIITGFLILVFATTCGPLVTSFLLHVEISSHYFAVAFASVFFAQVMSQGTEVFRLLYKPWSYIIAWNFQTLISVIIMLICILYFDLGILGYFIGLLIGSVFAACFVIYGIREYVHLNLFNPVIIRKIIVFSFPLLLSSLSMVIMSGADRWFLQFYWGEHLLGIYAVGAKFALIIGLAVETFRKAWWPIAMDSMFSSDGPKTFRMISRIYLGGGAILIVWLILLAPFLLKLFANRSYEGAVPLIGILSAQNVLFGFYLICSIGIWKRKKTYITLYLMLLASAICIVLNWVLVPLLGLIGAATATLGAHLILIILTIIISESLWKIHFKIGKFAIIFCITFVLGVILSTPFILLGFKLLIAVAGSFLIAFVTLKRIEILLMFREAQKLVKIPLSILK